MKQILIFGAYIENKGAQSMLFTVIDKVKTYHPDCSVYVVTEKQVETVVKDMYSFSFMELGIKSKMEFSGKLFTLISKFTRETANDSNIKKNIEIIKKSDMFIDISGFALSSKFSRNNTINYLSNISLAKRFNIPMYIMPQSFGPFDYKIIERPILMRLIKKLMVYPKRIYTREEEGYRILSRLGLNNITRSVDTVFYKNDEYNLNEIFKDSIKLETLKIGRDSVAIIPNVKTINENNKEQIYDLYKNIIEYLSAKEKKIYLIRHSTEDLNIIRNIYSSLEDKANVYLIEKEYSSIELQGIIKKFNFIIASRYHSIVHAYKVNTPAIVIGWAIKYKALTKVFNQEKYQFDIKNIETKKILEKIEYLNEQFECEKVTIKSRLDMLENENIFDEILIERK